jgi:hypothetical protein
LGATIPTLGAQAGVNVDSLGLGATIRTLGAVRAANGRSLGSCTDNGTLGAGTPSSGRFSVLGSPTARRQRARQRAGNAPATRRQRARSPGSARALGTDPQPGRPASDRATRPQTTTRRALG